MLKGTATDVRLGFSYKSRTSELHI